MGSISRCVGISPADAQAVMDDIIAADKRIHANLFIVKNLLI